MAGYRLTDRIRAAYSILTSQIDLAESPSDTTGGAGSRPGGTFREASSAVLAPVLNRMALDVASLRFRHVVVDDNEKYIDDVSSGLNHCLSVSPNIDQTPLSFMQDAVLTMLELGAVAIVPITTSSNPSKSDGYDILDIRAAPIISWNARTVVLDLYNDITGAREQKEFPKTYVAIAYNPLYLVMNADNSTLRRLRDKLYLLDSVDRESGSGKLDLLLQLPFALKGETRFSEATRRLQYLEQQLEGSRHGIGYIGATEKITQLNRPVTNNLMEQIEFLTVLLYNQIGLTPAVFDGSATPEVFLQYFNRTIVPIALSLTQAMRKAFLTRTAITQRKSVKYFIDLFKMAPLAVLAESADKLTRNAIMSSNELRGVLMLKPSKQKDADELRNKNIAEPLEKEQEKEVATDAPE